jgi:hypothetical protein
LILALSAQAGNLIVDPGFEHQTPPDAGGWILFGGQFANNFARSGNGSMLVAGANNVPGTFQQFPAAPGSKWQMTGYGMTPVPLFGPAFGFIQVTFFDIFGNDLGTVETTGNPFPAQTSGPVDQASKPGEWLFLDTGTATAPAGTAFIQAFTLYVDFTGYFQGVYFDDASLEVLAANHGQYVSSIAQNAAKLQGAGLITTDQAATMVRTAALSNGGTK